MDLKTEQRDPVIRESGVPQKTVKQSFIEDIKSELRQITWTSKEELFTYTQIVVGATFLLGLGVYLVDLSIQSVLDVLTWLVRVTIG
jgi:preprotein translocase subunit SecE